MEKPETKTVAPIVAARKTKIVKQQPRKQTTPKMQVYSCLVLRLTLCLTGLVRRYTNTFP